MASVFQWTVFQNNVFQTVTRNIDIVLVCPVRERSWAVSARTRDFIVPTRTRDFAVDRDHQ